MTDLQRNEPVSTDNERMPPSRERAFNIPAVVVSIIAVLVGIHLIGTYVLSDDQYVQLIFWGAFIPVRYTGGYALDLAAFTSPVTYSLLHGGFEHLIVNLIWLVAFGSPLAQRLGVARFLLFWVVASIAAAGLHMAFHPMGQSPLIGASGAIAGMMGAAARFGFQIDRSRPMPEFSGPVLPISLVLRNRGVLTFLLVWAVMNVATGLYSVSPDGGGIAWEAHIGGFILGFFGIRLFVPPMAGSRLEMAAGPAHDTDILESPEAGPEDGREPR